MKSVFKSLLLIAILLISACAKPVPEDKREYIGYWHSKNMTITISADGRLVYHRVRMKQGAKYSTKVDGPIKSYQGDELVVGVLSLTTTFKVSRPPYQEDGQWFMVVDGVTLKLIGNRLNKSMKINL